jgi:hypothetical protein
MSISLPIDNQIETVRSSQNQRERYGRLTDDHPIKPLILRRFCILLCILLLLLLGPISVFYTDRANRLAAITTTTTAIPPPDLLPIQVVQDV